MVVAQCAQMVNSEKKGKNSEGRWELRGQQLGGERRGKERVAETRQVGDGDVLILNVSVT
jgi:hypothetical protein